VIKKKDLSDNDLKDWQEYLKNPKDLFDKETLLKDNTLKKRLKFDLHGFTLTEANNKVKDLINFCIEKKYKEILLITGKGIHSNTDQDIYVSKDLSKLRFSIPNYLENDINLKKFISSIDPATIDDGGDGALIIKLKL